MKIVRFIAAILILTSGVLHITVYIQAPDNPGSIGILLFGVIYCVTGLLLFNSRIYPVYLGIFFPLTGMTLSLIKFGIPNLMSMSALFKLLGTTAIICCCYLLIKKRYRKA
jgi:uncharacterized membrane protein HdeD (DUF308 family)